MMVKAGFYLLNVCKFKLSDSPNCTILHPRMYFATKRDWFTTSHAKSDSIKNNNLI